jgi:DNA-binding MltR family transcriptional regulator
MATNDDQREHEFDPFWITGKALDREFELEATLLEFTRLFDHESDDRALVIVGGAFLETLLEHILIAFLIDDEKEVGELLRYDQPLGTYGGRVRAAYCFGLIPKIVRSDLSLIGKVRNKFARDLYASFADPAICSWCAGLQWHRKAYMLPPDDASARDLYYVGVHQLVAHLNGVVSIARSEKRVARDPR